ncbi:ribosome hibernation-promoting factor, HPF/YfiA family [Photobacterium leiognathi]|uniref:ribosome hibernation-promoting factor, HPF/YfiA family n=1 Tax=Photobacterium leiognathi TaxID=553611 RepID=UPI002734E008|nr:ribosome-associated translation inhibitor RaiA [Photobacterium leiognathi]
MGIKITARGFELPDYLEQHIKEAFFKFDKFKIAFQSKDVFMKLEEGRKFTVEIATKSNLGKIDATGEANELIDAFNEAFNEAFYRLERQIIKHKEKPQAHLSEKAQKEKENLIKEEAETLAKL